MGAYLEPLEDGRCRKWKLCVSFGSGENRRRYARTFYGLKREASLALRAFEDECAARPLEDFLLPEYMRGLASSRLAAGLISENTAAQYRWAACVLDGVLDLPLADISAADVRSALAKIAAGQTPSGRPLSAKSVLNLKKCASVAFSEAVRARLAPDNPFLGVVVPREISARKAAPGEAVAHLLGALGVESPAGFAVSVIARTGLRVSEALGVEWRDVSDCISVRREVTKTDAGVRRVPIGAGDWEYIDERRQFLERRLKRSGGVLEMSDRLCCGNDGRPLTYNAVRLWWSRHRAGLGFEGYTLHELRHTYLTNLAQAGAHPSVMQRLAGHSSVGVSLDIYTHVRDEDLRAAVASLSSVRNS